MLLCWQDLERDHSIVKLYVKPVHKLSGKGIAFFLLKEINMLSLEFSRSYLLLNCAVSLCAPCMIKKKQDKAYRKLTITAHKSTSRWLSLIEFGAKLIWKIFNVTRTNDDWNGRFKSFYDFLVIKDNRIVGVFRNMIIYFRILSKRKW